MIDKRKARDLLKLAGSIIFFWLYIPHLLIYLICPPAGLMKDMESMGKKTRLKLPRFLLFLYLIHNDDFYRKIFYHRIGPVKALAIGWWRPGNRYLVISKTTKLGGGVELLHPFSTVIHADSIGDYFSFRNCTTIGEKAEGRPTIGNNVTVGVNVCIIGKITIGDNVFIGAGSVVTKDIPANSVAVGNPAKVIKSLPPLPLHNADVL